MSYSPYKYNSFDDLIRYFIETHPDYFPCRSNGEALQEYLVLASRPPDISDFHDAYLKAKACGKLVLREPPQELLEKRLNHQNWFEALP